MCGLTHGGFPSPVKKLGLCPKAMGSPWAGVAQSD